MIEFASVQVGLNVGLFLTIFVTSVVAGKKWFARRASAGMASFAPDRHSASRLSAAGGVSARPGPARSSRLARSARIPRTRVTHGRRGAWTSVALLALMVAPVFVSVASFTLDATPTGQAPALDGNSAADLPDLQPLQPPTAVPDGDAPATLPGTPTADDDLDGLVDAPRAAATITSGLVGLWTLEYSPVDYKGHASSRSAGSYTTSGRHGSAGVFVKDDTSDLITVSDHADFDIDTGHSWSCWVYITDLPDSDCSAFLWKGNEYGLRVEVENDYAFTAFTYDSGDLGWRNAMGGQASANTWTHLAGVLSGSNLILYVNGNEVARHTAIDGVTPTANALTIGAQGTYRPVGARIDDVRIYNRALAAWEVRAVMDYRMSYSQQVQYGNFASCSPWSHGVITDDGGDDYSSCQSASTRSLFLLKGNADGWDDNEAAWAQQNISPGSGTSFAFSSDTTVKVVVGDCDIYADQQDDDWPNDDDGDVEADVFAVAGTSSQVGSSSYWHSLEYKDWGGLGSANDVNNYYTLSDTAVVSNYALSNLYVRVGIESFTHRGVDGTYGGTFTDDRWSRFYAYVTNIEAWVLWRDTQNPAVVVSSSGGTYAGANSFDYDPTNQPTDERVKWRLVDEVLNAGSALYQITGDYTGSWTSWTSGAEPYVDVGTNRAGTYSYTCTAQDGYGGQTGKVQSLTVNCINPNDVPSFTATAGNMKVDLAWTRITSQDDDGGAPITAYHIDRSVDGGAWDLNYHVADDLDSSWTDTSVTYSSTYKYRIRARNNPTAPGGGKYSSNYVESATVEPFHLPNYPGDFAATTGGSSLNHTIRLTWTAVDAGDLFGEPFYAYNLEYSTVGATGPWDPVPGGAIYVQGTTQFDHAGLTNGADYWHRIQTISGSLGGGFLYSEWSTIGATQPTCVPDIINGLHVASYGHQTVRIEWSEPAWNGDTSSRQYTIYRCEEADGDDPSNPGDYHVLTTRVVGQEYYDNTGLTNGDEYYYRVSATNGQGEGAQAPYVTGEPRRPPFPPTLSVSGHGDGSISLSWVLGDDGGRPVTGVSLYRRPLGSGTWGGSYVSWGYERTSFTDSPVTNGVAYEYMVTATNSEGEGDESNYVNEYASTTPGTPTWATNVENDGSVSLDWNAPSDGGATITEYEIYRGYNVGAEDYLDSVTGNPAGTSYVDNTAVNGITYYYVVRAINRDGGANSTATGALVPYGAPGQPGNFAVDAGNQRCDISWTASDPNGRPVTWYHIETNSTVGGGWYYLTSVDATGGGPYQFQHTGLTNYQTYMYRVTPVNLRGNGTLTAELEGTPEPGPPDAMTGLTVTVEGVGSITITWDQPDWGGGNGTFLDYSVYRGLSAGSRTEFIGNVSNIATPTFTDTNADNGVRYYYGVFAVNEKGNGTMSAPDDGMAYRVPDPPSDLALTPGDEQIALSWTVPGPYGSTPFDGGRDVDWIHVWRATTHDGVYSKVHSEPGTSSGWTDTSLTNGQWYHYYVTAENLRGVSATNSSMQADFPCRVPDAPTGLSVTQVLSTRVDLLWSAPGDDGGADIDYYNVYLKDELGTWTFYDATPDGSTTTMSVTSLTNGHHYLFYVRAHNKVGLGAISASTGSRPITVPDAPTLTSATADDGSVTIEWDAPAFTGGSNGRGWSVPIQGYIIYQSEDGGAYLEIDHVTGQTSYEATGLTNGLYYRFKVSAWNNGTYPGTTPGGEGAQSNDLGALPITTPDAPTLDTITASDGSITIEWTAPTSPNTGGVDIPLSGFVVYRAVHNYGTLAYYTTIANPGATDYTDNAVTNGYQYYYVVAAYNNGSRSASPGGEGAQSSYLTAMPKTLPGAPTDLTATGHDGYVTLDWTAPVFTGGVGVPITGYVIYRGTSADACTYHQTVGNVETWDDDVSLVHGTTYYYKVAAYNNGSRSASPGGEGDNCTLTPHATPTLSLHLTVLDAAESALAGAEVRLRDLVGGIYDAQDTTNSTGGIKFTGLNNSANYDLFITLNGYTIYDADGLTVNEADFELSHSVICNLTNFVFTIEDLDGEVVPDAYVYFEDQADGSVTFSGTTNATGQIPFDLMYNGTWLLQINYTTGTNNTVFTLNDTLYFVETALELNETTIVCNLTTITIWAHDPWVQPPYDGLNSANLTISNPYVADLNYTHFVTNSTGWAILKLPAAKYNLTLTYLLKPRKYNGGLYEHTLNFLTTKAFQLDVEIDEIHTTVFLRDYAYGYPGWPHVENGQLMSLYYNDTVTMTFFWQNDRNLEGVTNATGDTDYNEWTLTYDGTVVADKAGDPFALQPVGGEIGNYTWTFDSTSFDLAGTYTFSLTMGTSNETYQQANILITIEVLNYTTSLSLDSGTPSVYWNEQMTLYFDYASVEPEVVGVQWAQLNWTLYDLGNNPLESGTWALTYLPGSGLYQFQHTFTQDAGTYKLVVYGNLTNFDFASTSTFVVVNDVPTTLTTTIGADFEISGTYMAVAHGENITVDVAYQDYTPAYLDGATIDVTLDGAPLADVYDTATGRWQISTEANNTTPGVYTLWIQVSKNHYVTRSTSITVDILDYWNSKLTITTPPESATWADNVSFVVYYECNQQPRPGRALAGANITQLNVTCFAEGTEYDQVAFTDAEWNETWGYFDLGAGYYKVWLLSEVLNLTNSTLFYIIPRFNRTVYRPKTIKPYVWLSTMSTDLTVTASATPEENFALLESELGDFVTLQALYEASEAIDYYLNWGDGMPIDYLKHADATYSIVNTETEQVLRAGDLDNHEDGTYHYLLEATDLGSFQVTLALSMQNFTARVQVFNWVVTKEIEFTYTIAEDVRLNAQTMKLAQGENVSLTVDVTDAFVTNPTVTVSIGTTEIPVQYVYPAGGNQFVVMYPNTAGLSVGSHEILVVVSEEDFITSSAEIELQVIASWETGADAFFETVGIHPWATNISFYATYSGGEFPRLDELTGGSIAQLTLSTKVGGVPTVQAVLDGATRGIDWDYLWQSENPLDENAPGAYLIWFNASRVTVTERTTIYVSFTLAQQYYSPKTLEVYTWVTPVETDLAHTNADVVYSAVYLTETYQVNLFVTDTSSVFYGQYLAGASLQYEITETTATGPLTDLGNGSYTFSLTFNPPALGANTYTMVVSSQLANFTDASTTFNVIVLPGAVNFTTTIQADLRVNPWTAQAAYGENVNLWVDLDPTLDLTGVVVTARIGVTDFSAYLTAESAYRYRLTFPANQLPASQGYYGIVINVTKPGFLSKESTINLKVVTAWGATLELLQPPNLGPWNTNVSFLVKYVCEDAPRTGWAISGATISGLQVQKITDQGAIQLLALDASTRGTLWGWSDLAASRGAGFYEIWFNSSYVTINELSSYYLIPTIQGGVYEQVTIVPFVWIRPVETSLTLDCPRTDNLVVGGLTVTLDEQAVIEALFNVTDAQSGLFGNNLSGALLTYAIRYLNGTLHQQGTLQDVGAGYYRVNLTAIQIENFTVTIQAALTNYTTASATFRFTVNRRQMDFTDRSIRFVGANVDVAQNRPLDLVLDVVDPLTGQPLANATLFVELFGRMYNFTDSPDAPGRYRILVPAADIGELPEDQVYTVRCSLQKTNYTTYDFQLYMNIGLRVDPVFGIPYRYWTIAVVAMAVMVGIAVARSYYLKATVPQEVQTINMMLKKFKKGKEVKSKKYAPTPAEEKLERFEKEWAALGLDMRPSLGMPPKKGGIKPKPGVQKTEADLEEELAGMDMLEAQIPDDETPSEEELDDLLNLDVDDLDGENQQ